MADVNSPSEQNYRNYLIEDHPEDTLDRVIATLTAIGMHFETCTEELSPIELQGLGMLILSARDAVNHARQNIE